MRASSGTAASGQVLAGLEGIIRTLLRDKTLGKRIADRADDEAAHHAGIAEAYLELDPCRRRHAPSVARQIVRARLRVDPVRLHVARQTDVPDGFFRRADENLGEPADDARGHEQQH